MNFGRRFFATFTAWSLLLLVLAQPIVGRIMYRRRAAPTGLTDTNVSNIIAVQKKCPTHLRLDNRQRCRKVFRCEFIRVLLYMC